MKKNEAKILLTYNEASILGAFGEASEVSIPELAVSAKLTPSETKDALLGLIDKELVNFFDDHKFVRLTLKGENARLSWAFEVSDLSREKLYPSPKTGSSGALGIDEALKREIEKL